MMKYTISFLFVCLQLSLPIIGTAAVGTIEIQGTGYGASKQESILDAIADALATHHGGTIESKQEFHILTSEASSTTNNDTTSSIVVSDSLRTKISSKISGDYSGYNVINSFQESKHNWESLVSIEIANYVSPVPITRRTFAVIPFKTNNNYSVDDVNFKGTEIADHLEQYITSEMNQNRRFDILDRSFIKEYENEIDLIESENAGPNEFARAGNILGADYILVGSVGDLNFDSQSAVGRYTGQTRVSSTGYVRVHFRVIETAYRRVKWSDYVEFDVSELDFPRNDPKSKLNFALEAVADSMANQITENIYPIRVETVNGDELILGQGGDSLEVGQILDLYLEGELLKDTYTNESLGRKEAYIGAIEIIRKVGKYSTARMLEGEISRVVPKKTVARRLIDSEARQTQPQQPPVSKKREVEPGASGGVKMPWQN